MSRDNHYCRECMGRCELVSAAYNQGRADALQPATSEPTFAAEHFRFGPCVHSMVKPDCPSCCQSHAIRLEAQLKKLEHSTALPIRERIEKALREHMQHCYQVYKGVPPTVEDWVGGALHYVTWGIDQDLPATSERCIRCGRVKETAPDIEPQVCEVETPEIFCVFPSNTQPTGERCGKCGHSDGVDERGVCKNPDYNPNTTSCLCHGCLCKCVFPTTEAPPNFAITELLRAALEHPESAEGYVRQAIEMLVATTGAGEGERYTYKDYALNCAECGALTKRVDRKYGHHVCEKCELVPPTSPSAAEGKDDPFEQLKDKYNHDPSWIDFPRWLDRYRESTKERFAEPSTTDEGAREVAKEIAERWFNDDLPQTARLHSLKLLQLQELAERVISKYRMADAGEVGRLQRELAHAVRKWQDYERDYILPCFKWATECGIDLQQLVTEKAGRNCVELLVSRLRVELSAAQGAVKALVAEFDHAAWKGFNQSDSEFEKGYKHAMGVAGRRVVESLTKQEGEDGPTITNMD